MDFNKPIISAFLEEENTVSLFTLCLENKQENSSSPETTAHSCVRGLFQVQIWQMWGNTHI